MLGQRGVLMNSFYEHHKDSIRWHYRCFDRILLNGLIQPFQQPERVVGFFNTYRQLYPVSRNTLRGIAEQFQAWLKALARDRSSGRYPGPRRRHSASCDTVRDVSVLEKAVCRRRLPGTGIPEGLGENPPPFSKLKSSSAPITPKDLGCFHAVGSSNGRLRGSTAADDSQRIEKT